MIFYKVTFLNKKQNLNLTISVSSKEYLLSAAEKQGLFLPFSCRIGNCSTCTCKVIKGTILHDNQTFLTKAELSQNYCLSCVAYPQSDLIIETHMEETLY